LFISGEPNEYPTSVMARTIIGEVVPPVMLAVAELNRRRRFDYEVADLFLQEI
jgi:hypothetical protein